MQRPDLLGEACMKKLSLWYPGSFQHVELESSTWRTTQPHPTIKLIQRANGGLKSAPPPPRTGVNLFDHFLLNIDGRERALSLGRTLSIGIPDNSAKWAKAYLVDDKSARAVGHNKYINYAEARPSALWTTLTTPDVSDFWMGICFNGAVTLPGVRGTLFLGVIWKLGDFANRYIMGGWGGYAAAGGGASGSAGVVILCGFNRAADMVDWTKGEVGLQLSAGGNWSDFLGAARKYGPMMTRLQPVFDGYIKARAAIKRREKVLEGYEFGKEMLDRASRWKKLSEVAAKAWKDTVAEKGILDSLKAMNDAEFAKVLMTCAGFDGTKAGMDFVGFGGGGELSVYAGYSKIEFIKKM